MPAGVGVTQKTQAMMSNRTATGSLVLGGRCIALFIQRRGTDATGRGEVDHRSRLLRRQEDISRVWANAHEVFAYHSFEFLECRWIYIEFPLQILCGWKTCL